MKHTVEIVGWDDITVVEIEVFDEEWETICKLAELVNRTSSCQCEPRILCDSIMVGKEEK